MKKVLASLALACLWTGTALGQDRVHSDLPLFSGKNEELWPRGFVDDDSWGCTSRIAFGDWKYAEADELGGEPFVQWLRLRNYGVFHCAVVEEWADDRMGLGRHGYKHSWFVELGRTKRGASEVELWALQSGAQPGSDYLLLARKPGNGVIKSFEVLPVECPRKHLREGDGPDIWRADYCAINSVTELRSFASRMAQRTPAGTLTYVEQASEEKDTED